MWQKHQKSNGEKVDWLWQEYFKDPSLWNHSYNTKCSSRLADFTHKTTCKSLLIDAWYNPSWVCEELFRRKIVVDRKGNNGNKVIDGKFKEEFILVEMFKDYAKKKDLHAGSRLHASILDKGLVEKNPYLATTIISMYVKCGDLTKAQKVLEDLPFRNVVSWAALVVGYVQKGQMHQALHCFERMQNEGHNADPITLTCILKACSNTLDIDKGKQIHDEIVGRRLLEKDIVLGTALVDMYAKCGEITKAHEVLELLPIRNVVSWNALIVGHGQKGRCHEAFICFEQMKNEGISPNIISFLGVLKACTASGAIDEGIRLHDEIVESGFLEKSVVIGTALIDMYAKCGLLARAHNVLDALPIRNTVSWSALISGYAHQGQVDEALKCVDRMKREEIHPDEVIFTSILKACGSTGALEKGKLIHNEIASRGLLEKDILLGTALVDMYAKCGVPVKAQEVLEGLAVRNDISWCALIAGYVQQGQCCEALNCYEWMHTEGLTSDVVTLTCVLKACGITRAIEKGKQIHEEILCRGLLKKDMMLGTALVDMYAKWGDLSKAQQVLEELCIRDVACWSALIAGYSEQGQDFEVLNTFERMQSEGISPTVLTLIRTLTSCGIMADINKGRKIHKEIIDRGLLEKDIVLGNALVGMYVKCGELAIAHKVLEELPVRNAISWSTVISGYAEQDQCHEALNFFEWMQSEGLSPNIVSFICILKACGRAGAIDKGKQIHNEIINKQLLGKDSMLGTALIDMYAKCGMLLKAQQVLEELSVRDVVSWNALIAGQAQQGQGHEALNCFDRMQNEGLSPDEVTFLCVLSACCRSGLLFDAELLFEDMTRKYGIIPNIEHYSCMIIVYGCAGHFDSAVSLMKTTTSLDYHVIWLALLGSCKRWGNVKLGRLAFDQAVQLGNACSAAYVLMASIFSAAGMLEDAEKLEALRMKYAAGKEENSTCIDTNVDILLGIDIILR